MTNPFAAAAASATSKTGAKPTPTNNKFLIVPDDSDIRQAIDDFNEARADEKEAKSRKDVAKSVVTVSAKSDFFSMFSQDGVKPDKALEFQGFKSSIKLIVKDCGGDERFYISDEQLHILQQLLGEDVVADILVEHMRYTFEPEILAKDGVMTELGSCIQQMVADGILSEDEGGRLLSARPVRTVKKGTLAKLASLGGNDPETMQAVCDALGTTAQISIR